MKKETFLEIIFEDITQHDDKLLEDFDKDKLENLIVIKRCYGRLLKQDKKFISLISIEDLNVAHSEKEANIFMIPKGVIKKIKILK